MQQNKNAVYSVFSEANKTMRCVLSILTWWS